MKRLRHKKVHKKILFFQKKNYETSRGKRNPEFFSKMQLFSKIRFFSRKSDFFLSRIRIFYRKFDFFPLENPNFFENIRNSGGGPLLYTTFRKHTKSSVWSLSEFPCFIVYAAHNIPSISDTMWCKAGFILRTP